MSQTKQMNFQVLPETRERIRQIAKMTYRGYGDTLDWLVAEAWERIQIANQEKMTVNGSVDREEK